jgi:hypothetical protein
MRAEHMRQLAVAAMLLGASATWSQERSPYTLNIDRAPYILTVPGGSADAAGAGASAPAAAERQGPPSRQSAAQFENRTFELERAAAARGASEASLAARNREQDQLISQLVRERDAWKLRADALESQLRASRGSMPGFIPPAPSR